MSESETPLDATLWKILCVAWGCSILATGGAYVAGFDDLVTAGMVVMTVGLVTTVLMLLYEVSQGTLREAM